jgi:hypothetical protein
LSRFSGSRGEVMSGHYSNIYELQQKQETKNLKQEIRDVINKMSLEDLQLLSKIVFGFDTYKNFFEAIKLISKIEF